MTDKDKIIEKLSNKIVMLTQENELIKDEHKKLTEYLSAALDRTGLFIWEQHIPSGQLKILDQAFGSMCGFETNEIESTVSSWKNNLHPDDKEKVIAAFEEHLAGITPYFYMTYRMKHKDGGDVWVSDRGRVIEFDDDNNPLRMTGTHTDITQEKLYELELAQYANLDPLTNLLNRKALQHNFEVYTNTSKYCGGALFFIDLDDFKSINDIYGHKVGDKLLLHVTSNFDALAPTDALIARFGGDEFAIICKTTDRLALELLAQSILTILAKPTEIEGIKISINLSIGICVFEKNNESFANIYERADKAMYSVKRKGKNHYAFWDEDKES
ncbi:MULTISPECIES: sensor domain-containing diguanylate cyclase [unclassified Colwellia]|uniref:sensor domain-containing diguanylate cyclase n=1 Tax=unclassified Colwellia TaxID=196834 RepID=UPI0015F519DE|nr:MULTISPECIES: sensor domain-containing diguanylate cyclase [unclassified Colwellia]MBA6349613.1 sensor domain-containing diguanylate cyclase [Colwellia sp. BRX8-9]MBA6353812.1 sensor domain-containing diguanylate cyclase [Colwellia sp. BRX9-1]MBA6356764.1 sensor domain-containing diguanylate cyclase [Colwellia sp. BRX8-3]MBA6360377.1 sensor domain-containing diguanylate cyclase [Colwellia sp. BRX8-6]MBA6368727.1 sensor domain-containing diguanylate cyclase [Colwellia sp. BRX8-5]